MPKKIAIHEAPAVKGSRYPAPHDQPCRERFRRCLGDAAGLTQFGVNLNRLPPGSWSSQRHWHSAEDEFIFVVEGEVVLVTETGEETLRAGDCAGFKAGEPDCNHLQNRGEATALILKSTLDVPANPMSNIPISTFVCAPKATSARTAPPVAPDPIREVALRFWHSIAATRSKRGSH